MSTPRVFVSYSHTDEAWKDRLVSHLRVLEMMEALDIWDDRRIAAGADWLPELKKALHDAEVAILLISADFLVSEYIRDQEIPVLIRRRAEEGVRILPIIARPCAWDAVGWLRTLQVRPRDGRALSAVTNHEIDVELAGIAREIREFLSASPAAHRPQERPKSTPKEIKEAENQEFPSLFISHSHDDGDFAEVLKLRLEKEGYSAWIDIERLTVGVDWRQEIDQAVRSSLALIAVMTPEARKSEYVTYEWAYAWGVGVKVIPIMLRQTPLHPRLETLQYLDFTNRVARPWTQLFEALKEVVNAR